MIGFKQFLIEKDMSGERDSTLYIACSLPKEYWVKWVSLVGNIDDAVEIEKEPHITFLWCKLKRDDYDTQALFDAVNPLLSGLSFTLTSPDGFEVFKGVEQGKQDCLVVRLTPPDDIIVLQSKVKDALKEAGFEYTQTYPTWKPHMTIGYFKAGSDIKYDIADFETTKVSTEKTFMKHNNGKEMEFN